MENRQEVLGPCVGNEEMKVHVYQSIWNLTFYAQLLGGEFANCHACGLTRKQALTRLKLKVEALRNQRDKTMIQHQTQRKTCPRCNGYGFLVKQEDVVETRSGKLVMVETDRYAAPTDKQADSGDRHLLC